MGSLLALLFLGLGLLVTFLILTRYLQVVLEYPVARSGTALLPMAAAAVIAATQVAARLCHRLAPRKLIVPGLLLTAAGLVVLTGIDADSAYTAQVLPGTLLIGFGAGLAFTPLFTTATDGIAPQDSGGTSAVVLAAQNLGGWAAWPCSAPSSPRRSPPGCPARRTFPPRWWPRPRPVCRSTGTICRNRSPAPSSGSTRRSWTDTPPSCGGRPASPSSRACSPL